jgi:hypothetical protein
MSKSTKNASEASVKGNINSSLYKLCKELEKAANGLTYTSESDNPYQFFALQQRSLHEQGDRLTCLEFLGCIGLSEELLNNLKVPVNQLIEERSFTGFFPTLEEIAGGSENINDPDAIAQSNQYRKLERLLTKRLRDIKVFRVGVVDVRCYIAGFFNEGNIAGLVTTSIET